MNIANSNNSYGIVSILLHWIMAVLIMGLFALGKYMVNLDYYNPWYHLGPWWHKSVGVAVFALLILRLAWRLGNATPEVLHTHKSWEIKASKAVQILFYVLILAPCISGYLISTSKGAGIEVFGLLELPPVIEYGDIQADLSGEIHEISTHALLVLFVLHVAAALKHHFMDKDATLIRMLKP